MNKPSSKRIFLSPPHMSGEELQLVEDAFESNYIAPLGPMVDAFERKFSEYIGIEHCVALSSGTAAMHLALKGLDIGPGDEVFASSLTFIGSVTPIVFEGATPVFIDCDRTSWNMDPGLLEEELERCEKRGRLPKAVVPTDLYGQCCDLGRIVEICDVYGVPVICDSAESLGARYLAQRRKDAKINEKSEIRNPKSFRGVGPYGPEAEIWRHAGCGARAAIFSFNGNKIITTSGGGMLASDDREVIEQARFLSQQARDMAAHYEHSQIGYNYRMSNILAAIGRGQLKVLNERVKRKRDIFDYYREAFEGVSGIQFMPEPEWSRSNRWLTVVLISPEAFGRDRETVRLALEEENIEARPMWKPMHLQPVFRVETESSKLKGKEQVSRKGAKAQRKNIKKRYPCRVVGGNVAEDLFDRGLCLPSGTAMTEGDLDKVVGTILKSHYGVKRP